MITRALFLTLLFPSFLLADGTLVNSGIAGDMDAKDRAPILTETHSGRDPVKFIADVEVANKDYAKYPVEVKWFINRKLFATQLRSPELPGALGVDIGIDIAEPPFTYAVIATLIHPNRQFSSSIYGAVYPEDLATTLDCTFTLENFGTAEETLAFVANSVKLKQSGNTGFSVEFEAKDTDNENSLVLVANLSKDSEIAASGSANYKINDESLIAAISGDLVFTNSSLSSVDLSNSDGSVVLKCL